MFGHWHMQRIHEKQARHLARCWGYGPGEPRDDRRDEPGPHLFGGRSGRGPGRHGFGGPGGFGFGPFGMGGHGPHGLGFRFGRKLSSADLQLLLLALLDEKGRHGYDLIKALEERSNGFYVPSPGVIYPALTYLEEAGEAISEAQGSKKLYQLTEAGKKRVQEHRLEVDTLFARLEEMGKGMDRLREAFAGDPEATPLHSLRDLWRSSPEVLEALRKLRGLLVEHRGVTREKWQKVARVLDRAADELRAILTSEPPNSKP